MIIKKEIIRQLCGWKGVEIIEGKVCPDYTYNTSYPSQDELVIPPKMSVSSFMGYLKGKSLLLIYQEWWNMKFA